MSLCMWLFEHRDRQKPVAPVLGPADGCKNYNGVLIWVRFHIQTLIPCLLTHCTTGCVKSSCLYTLNRGITEDQTDISQQKTTCAGLVSNQRKLPFALRRDVSVYNEKQYKISKSHTSQSSYLFNLEVNYRPTWVLITPQTTVHHRTKAQL